MEKVKVKIEGMMCGMCEAHICDTIRKAFPGAKKVSASKSKKEAVFLIENGFDSALLEKAIAETGYTFVSCSTEPYKKKGLFSR